MNHYEALLNRSTNPFAGWDIRTLVDGMARIRQQAPFLIWEPFEGETKTTSYQAFAVAVRQFAAGLQKRGVRQGDRVLVHLNNCPEAVISWIGCAYYGAVAVTTNTRSSGSEMAFFALHSGAVGAITQPCYADLLAAAAPQLAWICVTATDGGLPPINNCDYEPIAKIYGDPSDLPTREADPWATFSIQYTSGTTSRPKAVRWTHSNALWAARVSAMHQGLNPSDIHLVHLPLFHTNAQMYSVGAALWAGATAVIMPRFSASRFWDIALKHRCTWTSMVPFCIRALELQSAPERHSFRVWGSTCTAPSAESRYGVTTLGWWGMTETLTQGIVGVAGLPSAPGSIGRPSPLYEIHVLNDRMQPVGIGETGNLFVRGVRGISLFHDYFDDPEATVASFTDNGLFITGDRIRLGEDGSLFFAERAKDMLKVGGENVSASEIEDIIATVEGVAEVAVIGQPHPMLDEVPVAFVVPIGDAAVLRDRISAKCSSQLSDFKQPAVILFVPELPRTTLEKISKVELRKLLSSQEMTLDRPQLERGDSSCG